MCMLAAVCFDEASQATLRRARDMLSLSREHSKNPGHRFMRRETQRLLGDSVPKCAVLWNAMKSMRTPASVPYPEI